MASPKTRDLCCNELHASHADVVNRAALIAAFEQRVTLCKGKLPSARFLNKNPHLCNKLPLVNSLFPSAHYIWVHRGLLQVVASIKRLFEEVHQRRNIWHWWPLEHETVKNRCWSAFFEQESNTAIDSERIFPGGNIKFIAEYWIESNRAIHDFYRQNKQAITVVSEEQLLAAPEEELNRICHELGIFADFPRDVLSSLNSSFNNAWKSLLSHKEMTDLKQLIYERRDEIDSLFPNPRALNWIGEIESQLT